MRSKKLNEMRSILLKGFGYARLLGSQPNKVSADSPAKIIRLISQFSFKKVFLKLV